MRLPAFVILASLVSTVSLAAAAPITMTLKNHVFSPATVSVPAGQRVTIQLINQDIATEEFDSHDLKVEKLVTPGGRTTISVGPLPAGAYSFMGEFHPKTAQGKLIVTAER